MRRRAWHRRLDDLLSSRCRLTSVPCWARAYWGRNSRQADEQLCLEAQVQVIEKPHFCSLVLLRRLCAKCDKKLFAPMRSPRFLFATILRGLLLSSTPLAADCKCHLFYIAIVIIFLLGLFLHPFQGSLGRTSWAGSGAAPSSNPSSLLPRTEAE